jgi:GDPmannose 4,6-dehydratase
MKALITGITGQDASYLTELLLDKGYEVHGIKRRSSQHNLDNISHIIDQIVIHYADMTDAISIRNVIELVRPDEIYNLAGMSQVRVSYDIPANTMAVNTIGLLNIIEAVRGISLDCKIYQACSSEMFGKVQEVPQRETTPFYPRSPYGVSKAAAYYLARTYRESYGMKIYCGILFNHESPRRGEEFLSRKVAKAVAEIKSGVRSKITLGNLDAKRDWGYAKEYTEWIYAIVQHPYPDDFVIATGETHSVREFVEEAFFVAGIDNWEDYVDYDKYLLRPAEVDLLIGDPSKSKRVLGFEPKVKFKELVKIMVEHEIESCFSRPPAPAL